MSSFSKNKLVIDHEKSLKFLDEYRAPNYLIDKTDLHINIRSGITIVTSRLTMRYNPNSNSKDRQRPLIFDGVNLKLISLSLDGKVLDKSAYIVDEKSLSINELPPSFTVEFVTAILPDENTALVGLYITQGIYCTQCEPEGFRRITYYLDRPDILSEFTTTIVADKADCPVLLSNGNLIAKGDIDDQAGRHWATWHDPFRKPSAVFAIVAGQLDCIEDVFTTCSGREITIGIFAASKNLAQCHYAMAVTKQAMAWDERVYGREYDLDVFMIAVITDFNIGGMENKGLNIYRSDCLLTDPRTTCDADIQSITETIAHEYFHNWSGNRVVCRDWFQLTLKEGFTTYRGFQFCHDRYSAVVKRIEETLFVRTTQFAEDASPLAHPIRPAAYRAIWNFYTPTVYQKGAEVVRMLHTLFGDDLYWQGCDKFFTQHDGSVATTEDFIAAMELAADRDLSQFKYWYSQSGTPQVMLKGDYNAKQKNFRLTVSQNSVKPMHIPLSMSLVGNKGPIKLNRVSEQPLGQETILLEINHAEQIFVFENINERPVPALFRDFSAPVKWTYDYSERDLLRIMHKEPSGYCRWEAGQLLWISLIKQWLRAPSNSLVVDIPRDVLGYYQGLIAAALDDPCDNQALTAQCLTLPNTVYLFESGQLPKSIDIIDIDQSCQVLKKSFSLALKHNFENLYGVYKISEPVNITPKGMSERSLRNLALDYLVTTDDPIWLERCYQQNQTANNMTDALAALTCLVNNGTSCAKNLRQRALDTFYQKWQHHPLVINQWFKVQACCQLPDTVSNVRALTDHPSFDIKNPSQVNALITNFCISNTMNFHHESGSGYQFLVDQILTLDIINPQLASRILGRSPLINWRRFDEKRQYLMRAQLRRLESFSNQSNELSEIINKCLADHNCRVDVLHDA